MDLEKKPMEYVDAGMEAPEEPIDEDYAEESDQTEAEQADEHPGEEIDETGEEALPEIDPQLNNLTGTDSSDWDGTADETFHPSADSHLRAHYPDDNLGSSSQLYIGKNYGTTSGIRRTLARFDISSIPASASVTAATLALYLIWCDGRMNPSGDISIHRISQSPARDWVEAEVNWNRFASGSPWTNPGGDFEDTASSVNTVSCTVGTYTQWNVMDDAADFVRKPLTNYGWILKQQSEPSDFLFYFNSKEADSGAPRLRVAYDAPHYDIEGTIGTDGLLAGDNADYLAFGMRLAALSGGSGFTVDNMTAGDKYEIYFTIGDVAFVMFFVASGPGAGKSALMPNYGFGWVREGSFEQSSILSSACYESDEGDMAFRLSDSTAGGHGIIKFVLQKEYLASLDASGDIVTDVHARTYSGSAASSGVPGEDGGRILDRCPSGEDTATYVFNTPL